MSEDAVSHWELPAGLPRRWVNARTPRGIALCVQCGQELNYAYGSIAWQCQTEDLCPSCAAIKAVERIFADNPLNLSAEDRS